MLFKGDKQSEAYIDDLRRRAFELGLEVGKANHLETVGWVSSEIRHLKEEAEQAEALEEIQMEYQRGKKLGVARRARLASGVHGGLAKKTVEPFNPPGGPPKPTRPTRPFLSAGFVERISVEEGLRSTIGVMKFAASEPRVKKDLDGLFASILDIQEMLIDVEPGDTPRETFERCLKLLKDVGWIEKYDLASFNETMASVVIRSPTTIASAFEHSDQPLCRPVCNLLETAGRKAFDRSVMVVEDECIAQGRGTCRFEVTPRKARGRS
jgi:hypothetical protein